MVKIEWLELAKNDLIQIYNYIYQDSIYYSIKTVNDIINLTNYLEASPYMGRKVPEYNRNTERELIYKSYRIIYRVEFERIFIRRIWHSARILLKYLIS